MFYDSIFYNHQYTYFYNINHFVTISCKILGKFSCLYQLTNRVGNTNIVGIGVSSNAANYSVPLEVFSLVTPYRVTINCHVLYKITCNIPQYKIDASSIKIPPNVELADVDFNIPSEINMLHY